MINRKIFCKSGPSFLPHAGRETSTGCQANVRRRSEIGELLVTKSYTNLHLWAYYNCDTSTIRARFDYDSTTIQLQHATTRYEVFRALAYEIVYENQW